jgi:hypothetical protein
VAERNGRTILAGWELCRDFDLFDVRSRFGNSVTIDPHPFDVELDGLAFEFTRFFKRRGGRDTTRENGDVRALAGSGRFEKYGVGAHFKSAWFSMEL